MSEAARRYARGNKALYDAFVAGWIACDFQWFRNKKK